MGGYRIRMAETDEPSSWLMLQKQYPASDLSGATAIKSSARSYPGTRIMARRSSTVMCSVPKAARCRAVNASASCSPVADRMWKPAGSSGSPIGSDNDLEKVNVRTGWNDEAMLLQDGQAPGIVLETGRVEGQIGVHTARNIAGGNQTPIQSPRLRCCCPVILGAISK